MITKYSIIVTPLRQKLQGEELAAIASQQHVCIIPQNTTGCKNFLSALSQF